MRETKEESSQTYTRGALDRNIVYASAAIVVISFVMGVWSVATGGWGDGLTELLTLVVFIGINFYQIVSDIFSRISLTEDTLRRTWPLKTDQEVRYEHVERVLLGGMAVEVYTTPDAPIHRPQDEMPDLQISRDLENAEHFITAFIDRLPLQVKVDNPSGEFAQLRRCRGIVRVRFYRGPISKPPNSTRPHTALEAGHSTHASSARSRFVCAPIASLIGGRHAAIDKAATRLSMGDLQFLPSL